MIQKRDSQFETVSSSSAVGTEDIKQVEFLQEPLTLLLRLLRRRRLVEIYIALCKLI